MCWRGKTCIFSDCIVCGLVSPIYLFFLKCVVVSVMDPGVQKEERRWREGGKGQSVRSA